MRTVAVFFGGNSSEHEISIITGVYAVNLLRGAGYCVLPVFLDDENAMWLGEKVRSIDDFKDYDEKKFRAVRLVKGGIAFERKMSKKMEVDCALNCCHGGLGEGGGLAALLEWYGIVSASPQMTGSAVFLDKAIAKAVLKGLDIPVVPSVTVREVEWSKNQSVQISAVEEKLGYPVIVKPSKLGSSVGISVAKNVEELKKSLEFSFRLDGTALIEKYLEGKRDLNCAAYRRNVDILLSDVEEVFSNQPILTFGEKYEGGSARTSKQPAEIPLNISEKIGEYLCRIYNAFELRGIVRADFLLYGEEIYFNELNTVPGTLATYLYGESLLASRKLLERLIEDAIARGIGQKETVRSGILERQSFGGKSAKLR